MNASLLLLLAFLVLVESQVFVSQREINKEWLSWKMLHHPGYASKTDEEYRKAIFTRNLRYIKGQNRRFKAGLESYATALNQFADLTIEEFTSHFLGTKPQKLSGEKSPVAWKSTVALKDLPDSVDWRTKNLVTEVKNQVIGSISRFIYL